MEAAFSPEILTHISQTARRLISEEVLFIVTTLTASRLTDLCTLSML